MTYFNEENRKSKERCKEYDFKQLVFLTRKIRDKKEVRGMDLNILIALSDCRYEYMDSGLKHEDDGLPMLNRIDIGLETGLEKIYPSDKIKDICEIADVLSRQDRYYTILKNPEEFKQFTDTRNFYLKLFETDEMLNKYFHTPEKKAKYIEEAVTGYTSYWEKLKSEEPMRKEKINTFLKKYSGIREEKTLKDRLAISKEKLELFVEQIKPVVRKDNNLYYIKDVDPIKCSVIYDPKIRKKALGLEKIASIKTYHSQEVPWIIRPSIAEVLAQIPKRYLEQTRAFEILTKTYDEYNNTFKTILYKNII